jgi:hypothetical protein
MASKGQGRKSSEIEYQERVAFLLECMSKGVKGTSDLFRFFSEKWPGLTKRQFEYDLAAAKETILEYHAEDIEFLINDLTRHLWELYNKSLKIQDYRECRSIIKTIAEVTGALASKKIDVTSGGNPIQVTPISFYSSEEDEC